MTDERTVRQLREERIRTLDVLTADLSRIISYTQKIKAEYERERARHAEMLHAETRARQEAS